MGPNCCHGKITRGRINDKTLKNEISPEHKVPHEKKLRLALYYCVPYFEQNKGVFVPTSSN